MCRSPRPINPVHHAAAAVLSETVPPRMRNDAEQREEHRMKAAPSKPAVTMSRFRRPHNSAAATARARRSRRTRRNKEREAPDLRFSAAARAGRERGKASARPAAFSSSGSVLVPNQNTTAMTTRPTAQSSRNHLPAECHHDHGGKELGHRGADIADAEDSQRRALFFVRIPARYIGDADGERAAGDPDADRREDAKLVANAKP